MVMVKRSILSLLAVAALLTACKSGSDKTDGAVTPSTPGLSNEEVLAGFEPVGADMNADAEPVAVPETEPLEEE